jgi:hypothetical protein
MKVSDKATLARRAKVQALLTAVFAVLTILAVAVPVWIEETTGLSPDGGNGELELLLVVPFGIASIALALLTWRTRRASTLLRSTST